MRVLVLGATRLQYGLAYLRTERSLRPKIRLLSLGHRLLRFAVTPALKLLPLAYPEFVYPAVQYQRVARME